MAREVEQFSIGELTMLGIKKNINSTATMRVLVRDNEQLILMASGLAIPTDAQKGFATGCIFIQTTAGTLYSNRGDEDSCNFDAVTS